MAIDVNGESKNPLWPRNLICRRILVDETSEGLFKDLYPLTFGTSNQVS